jgi:alginate O-acetyltransferase complex protein AlgJ
MPAPQPAPPPSLRAAPLPAATFFLVLALGVAGTVTNPALLRAPAATLRDGAWAREYQAALDAASPLRPSAVALWNALDLRLFRQGPAGVVLGSDGWLFTAEEYASGAAGAWRADVDGVADRLRDDGVRLLVALVPAKARQVSAGQPPLPRAAEGRYDAGVAALRARGVEVVDLRPALAALGDDAWLRTDTHWTPAGATAAAAAIADRLRALDPDLGGEAGAAVEPAGSERFEGDLLRLLELGPLAERFGPEPDLLLRERLIPRAPTSTDLFAAVDLPVTMVGTSYAADERWNLARRVEALLGAEVLDAAEIGSGPIEPMAAYLGGEAYAGAPPRAIVWEIPERYLGDPSVWTGGPAVAGATGPRP